ncbi:unnamed protein product [Linum tenue]|uniref:Uncharacterized protein n=1 Tax=Linum tenue TaxID=586396 RepID=A0AAV0L631_9ROSI|nr:unnamed protein product [Linum tenue]
MMRSMHMGNSAPARGIAAIVGVGPKLGRSVARKFAHEGYTVAILARDLGRLSMFAEEIAREEKAQVFAIRIDCSDSRSIREAFEGVLSLGFVEVLVYNAYCPAALQPTNFADVSLAAFERSLAVSSVGAFLCAQQVIPGMVERRKGTILFTGCAASLNGIPGFSDLCTYYFVKKIDVVYFYVYIYTYIQGVDTCTVGACRLWEVCTERSIAVPGQRVPSSWSAYCPCCHRWSGWLT